MSIADYALKRKTVTLALTVSLFIAGIFSYLSLPRFEDPEFTIKDALIVTQRLASRLLRSVCKIITINKVCRMSGQYFAQKFEISLEASQKM